MSTIGTSLIFDYDTPVFFLSFPFIQYIAAVQYYSLQVTRFSRALECLSRFDFGGEA